MSQIHRLAAEIDLCEVDDFVAAAIEYGFDHEQAETLDLIDGNRRRHGEFLAADDGFNQGRPVMTKRLLDHGSNLVCRFSPKPEDARGVGDPGEIRIAQAGSKVEDAGRFHLQFDEGERAIAEDDQLDRQLQLTKREQIAHKHGEASVS